MKKAEILGLGEAVVDWVVKIPRYPGPDEKIDAIHEDYFPGGVTANFLVAASRLGGKCGFIGAVGDDEYGNYLINAFQKENVDTSLTIKKKRMHTPVNYIMVVKGEKSIIQSPRMLQTRLNIDDLDESYFKYAKVLHTTLIHHNLSEEAIRIAKKFQIKVSIDLEPQIALRGWEKLKNVIRRADVIFPNKEGAKIITNTENLEKAAEFLIKKGVPLVVITMGKNGCLVTSKDFQEYVPAPKINNIVDTTGAGDTFNGAFTVAHWFKGLDLIKSCKYANAAAGLKITKLGARTGMPFEKELNKFLKETSYKI